MNPCDFLFDSKLSLNAKNLMLYIIRQRGVSREVSISRLLEIFSPDTEEILEALDELKKLGYLTSCDTDSNILILIGKEGLK